MVLQSRPKVRQLHLASRQATGAHCLSSPATQRPSGEAAARLQGTGKGPSAAVMYGLPLPMLLPAAALASGAQAAEAAAAAARWLRAAAAGGASASGCSLASAGGNCCETRAPRACCCVRKKFTGRMHQDGDGSPSPPHNICSGCSSPAALLLPLLLLLAASTGGAGCGLSKM